MVFVIYARSSEVANGEIYLFALRLRFKNSLANVR